MGHRQRSPSTSSDILALTHPGLTIHHAACIYYYDVLTSSLALISAPLSSRATTVAVWPSFDARRSTAFRKPYIYSGRF